MHNWLHLGDGLLHNAVQTLGLGRFTDDELHRLSSVTYGVLSEWNRSNWSEILGLLRSASGPVTLISDANRLPTLEPTWRLVNAPLLFEPLLADLEAFQRSGELVMYNASSSGGWCTVEAALMACLSNEHTVGEPLVINGQPMGVEATQRSIQRGLNRLHARPALVDMLFSDLDTDSSGYIEAAELLSMSHRFTDVDAAAFLASLDLDADGRISAQEFTPLVSDAMAAFVHQSIPKVRVHLEQGPEAFDELAALGFNGDDRARIIEAHHRPPLTGGVEIPISLESWAERRASTLIGVRMIPSVGLIRARTIRMGASPGRYVVLFRPDQQTLRIRRTPDGRQFEATIDGETGVTVVSWKKGRRSHRIELSSLGHPIRVVSRGTWSDQAAVLKAMVDRQPMLEDAIKNFELTGSLQAGAIDDLAASVCKCVDLDARTARSLMAAGLEDAVALVQQTGATTVCGGCTSTIEALFDSDGSIQRQRIGTMDVPVVKATSFDSEPSRSMMEEAEAFFLQMAAEGAIEPGRWDRVKSSIAETGTWTPTLEELSWGARVSWRNATRCVGRFFWDSLEVRDARDLTEPDDVFDAMFEHIKWATNNGDLRACMTVFQSADGDGVGPRLWNDQYIRYACHELPNGELLGDPSTRSLTHRIKALGWDVAEPTAFDVLPLVLEWPGRPPVVRDVPKELVLEVPIRHPEHPGLASMNLRWYALPAVSAMSLELGGLVFTLAPFNGFYMSTEIGARNFTDVERYNLMEPLADAMNIPRSSNRELWKDAVQVELNRAILHSFEADGVRMMDHHTLADYFLKFEQNERDAGRDVFAEWAWIVPPIGASATPLYLCDHWENVILKPNLFYLPAIHDTAAPMGHGTPARDPDMRCPFGHDAP